MIIHQFYDKFLAHASYVIVSEQEAVVIDPSRNPEPYYDFVRSHGAQIKAVIETHPHADFISSHLEISCTTGAPVYASKLISPEYNFIPFDEGNSFAIGKLTLHALNTPGHSPDSICIVLRDEHGITKAVFTGDTLFIGDVGRPDLRESAGALTQKREELARAMYHSLRDKLMKLPEDTLVYPAHGAGSLCGKSLSSDTFGTIGQEMKSNYALQPMLEKQFVSLLLEDQPFIPMYFAHAVDMNKRGAPSFRDSIAGIRRLSPDATLKADVLVIDSRPQEQFKAGHLPGAINNAAASKFETWLGSIVAPGEPFYLVAETMETGEKLLERIASIGYESQVEGLLTCPEKGLVSSHLTDVDQFRSNQNSYTIVDIRNNPEVKAGKIFPGSIHIPLYELRQRAGEIPEDKPVIVHCAGGYRSAAGSSILESLIDAPVYDLGSAITTFKTVTV